MLKKIIFVCGVLFCLFFSPYFACPIFDFKYSSPFVGDNFYNPYQKQNFAWFKCEKTNQKLHVIPLSDKDKFLQPKIKQIDIQIHSNKWNRDPDYFCLGTDRKIYTHFLGKTNNHHQQFLINRLRNTCDFLSINQSVTNKNIEQLSNYNAIIFQNRNDFSQWDSILSSGYFAVIDVYSIDNENFLIVNAKSNQKLDIITALKQGNHYAVFKSKTTQNDSNIVKPKSIKIEQNKIITTFSEKVANIKFIGQNGELKQQISYSYSGCYQFKENDAYIRIEVLDKNGNLLIFNPIVRCKNKFPINDFRFEINGSKTAIKHLAEFCAFLLLLFVFCKEKIKFIAKKIKKWLANSWHKKLFIVITISLLLRTIMTCCLELNNDELYYRFLSLYPALSYFDHPPMISWLINLTTLHFLFEQRIFLRFSALLLCSISSFIIFDIGRMLGDEKRGFFAALLFNLSPYVLLVTGTFILPDVGLMFFSLLSIRIMMKILLSNQQKKQTKLYLLMGIYIGLACLSKYTGIFLWIGFIGYILLYNRSLLKQKNLYLAFFLTVLCCFPILLWNINHDFISFRFHGNRVNGLSINLSAFFSELLGECIYNHPISFFMAIIVLVRFFVQKQFMPSFATVETLFFTISIPFLCLFWFFALFQPILPHWNAPAFTFLIIPLSGWINNSRKIKWIKSATILLLTIYILFLAYFFGENQFLTKFGIKDFSIELSTSEEEFKLFCNYAKEQERKGNMEIDMPIIVQRWMPAAQFEKYTTGRRVLTMAPLYCTHEFAWKTRSRDLLSIGNNYWFISNNFQTFSPYNLETCFHKIEPMDTLYIYHNQQVVKEVYVYKMTYLTHILPYFY